MLSKNNGRKLRVKMPMAIIGLAIIVVVGCTGYASDSFKLSVDDRQGKVDEQIYITIKAHNADSLEGGEFVLNYDAGLIKLVAYSAGKLLSEGSSSMHMANLDYKPGQAKFMWITAYADTPAEGELFTIKMELRKEGDAKLSLSDILVSPADIRIDASGESRIKILSSGESSGSETSLAGASNDGSASNPQAGDNHTTSSTDSSFTGSINEQASSDISYASSIIQDDYFFVIALNVVLFTVIAAVLIIRRKKNLTNKQNSNEAKT